LSDETPPQTIKKPSRIQLRNRKRILDAALDVFSRHGFPGATLDMIAAQAGLSKPNILYYFEGKEVIHVTLMNQMMDAWLDPLRALQEDGDPQNEILGYVQRKLDLARDRPRESRLFAGEILRGAPHMRPHLEAELHPLFHDKCALIQGWIDAGRLPQLDPRHLIISIWSTTQHYADFDAQVQVLLDGASAAEKHASASKHLAQLFGGLLHVTKN